MHFFISGSDDVSFTRKKFVFPVIGKQLYAANNIDKFYNRWLENQAGVDDANKFCTVDVTNSLKEEFTNDSVSYMDFFGNREAMRTVLKIEGIVVSFKYIIYNFHWFFTSQNFQQYKSKNSIQN